MPQFIGWGDGRDGAVSSASGTINSYAVANATAGTTTVTTALSVSAGDYVLLVQGTGASDHGKWEMVRVASTGSGNFTAGNVLDNTYSTGSANLSQAIKVPQYTGGTCANSLTGLARQSNVVSHGSNVTGGFAAFVVNGNLVWNGSFAMSSSGTSTIGTHTVYGFTGATGVNSRNPNNCAEGYLISSTTGQQTANGNGGGGGNGGGNGGGGGGNAAAGTAASGAGGLAAGNSALTVFDMGGGGGSPGGDGNNTGHGGNGGGCILVFAKGISGSGAFAVNASAGGGSGDSGGGGGGGAGGSILLKGQNINVSSMSISAAGAGSAKNGGAGGIGWVHYDYAYSFSGATSSTVTATQSVALADKGGSTFFYFL